MEAAGQELIRNGSVSLWISCGLFASFARQGESGVADEGTFDRFIERWRRNEGGAERANFPLFLTELCALLDLPQPDPADATHEHNDYVFERDVTTVDDDGNVNSVFDAD